MMHQDKCDVGVPADIFLGRGGNVGQIPMTDGLAMGRYQ